MSAVFGSDKIRLHHDANIGGIELVINHRAFPNKPTQAEITLDERGQLRQGPTGVLAVLGRKIHAHV